VGQLVGHDFLVRRPFKESDLLAQGRGVGAQFL
jgi:hypothetical protein